MARCTLCNHRMWALRGTSPRLCATCEATAEQDVGQRLANVKEEWQRFRGTQDDAAALSHLQSALWHARVLNSYRQRGNRHFVPSPPQVLELLERTMRQVAARSSGPRVTKGGGVRLSSTASGEGQMGGRGGPSPEAQPVVYATAPNAWFSLEPTAYSAFDLGVRGNDVPQEPIHLPPRAEERGMDSACGTWLGETSAAPTADEMELFGLATAAQRADRRGSRRLAPSGLFARILEKDESAEVMDLSKDGISLMTQSPEETGTTLNLIIGTNGERIGALGVVRWTSAVSPAAEEGAARMGLVFLHVHHFSSPELVQ